MSPATIREFPQPEDSPGANLWSKEGCFGRRNQAPLLGKGRKEATMSTLGGCDHHTGGGDGKGHHDSPEQKQLHVERVPGSHQIMH
jgi:hypothetical protein